MVQFWIQIHVLFLHNTIDSFIKASCSFVRHYLQGMDLFCITLTCRQPAHIIQLTILQYSPHTEVKESLMNN